ncbi:hypothetical protein Tco_1508791 [Tanacetum coccineum]
MAMTIQYGVKVMILAAQSEAFKEENAPTKRLHGLEHQMERKEDESLYFMDRIWVLLVGGVRTIIMDEAYKTRSPVLWAEIRESMLIRPELVQDTTDKVEDQVLLKVLPWKGVICFEKKGKLAPSMHDTFHVSNLKKCLADANLHVPLDEIKIDKTRHFVEEPIEIMDREVESLKRSKIPIVKVRWNSKRSLELTWEREDHMKAKIQLAKCEALVSIAVYYEVAPQSDRVCFYGKHGMIRDEVIASFCIRPQTSELDLIPETVVVEMNNECGKKDLQD